MVESIIKIVFFCIEGWIVKIQISDSTEIDSLLSDDDYKNLIG